MRHTLYILFSIAVLCLSGGCITEYTPRDLDGHESLLVVEGMISDGETVIKLSRSIALKPTEEKDPSMQPDLRISDAEVWIEGENGDHFGATLVDSGEYSAWGITLSDDVRYRLRISWDGEEYESEWRHPQTTPPIEKIAFHEKDELVQVRLDVRGDPGTPGYYFWSYDEIWEIHAYEMASRYLGEWDGDYGDLGIGRSYGEYYLDSFRYIPRDYPDFLSLYYYCWKYSNSRSLLLGSTERLTENTLRDHVLFEFGVSDDRISSLYYTNISQYLIGEDAYYYFSNQKKNTDETGSIFAPVPSEMPGNIICTSSPEIPVIGFIEVSRRVQREVFLKTEDSPYKMPFIECREWSTEDIETTISNFGDSLYYGQEFRKTFFLIDTDYYSTAVCQDCRTMGGAKVRPDWWPNNHF